jgi:WD40 repeat protein
VSGDFHSYVRAWDVTTGRLLRTFDSYEKGVTSLAMTPDGRFVLSGHGTGTVRVWQLDWELTAQDAADWDEGARPHLEAFLLRYGAAWTARDFESLLSRLQDVGFGWLRADGVRTQLGRMAA